MSVEPDRWHWRGAHEQPPRVAVGGRKSLDKGLVRTAMLAAILIGLVAGLYPMLGKQALQVQTKVAYFPNCGVAHAAGASPLYSGSPGYRPELDADLDGVACEVLPAN